MSALRSMAGKIKATFSYFAASVTAAITTGITAIDTVGFGSVSFVCTVGAFAFSGTNKWSLILEHSDDNVTFTACAASDVYNGASGGVFKVLDSALAAPASFTGHYIGNKRYVRANIVEGGTVDTSLHVVAVQGYHSQIQPPL